MSSHPVCLMLVGSFITSVETSASSNPYLLIMAKRFEMSLKCSARSFEVGIRVFDFSCAFGLSTLWYFRVFPKSANSSS
jgi:hypothetical protein